MLVCEIELLEEDDDTSPQACHYMSQCCRAQNRTPVQPKLLWEPCGLLAEVPGLSMCCSCQQEGFAATLSEQVMVCVMAYTGDAVGRTG